MIFLKSKSSAGYTNKSHNDFEKYLSEIANNYRPEDYQLFSRNCREYSQKLLTFLDPDNPREAKDRIPTRNTVGLTESNPSVGQIVELQFNPSPELLIC